MGGGIFSDWANVRWQMMGRLWTHFISLFGQAVFLFFFGCVTKDTGGWPVALFVLIVFAIFVNMAEGTSYGIVPYMIPTELAVVSAVVGAGGTLGAVIATWAFYKNFDTFTSLKLHAVYVLFWALTCFPMRWDHLGSMFGGPTNPESSTKTDQAQKEVEEPNVEVEKLSQEVQDLKKELGEIRKDVAELREARVRRQEDI